MSPVTICLVTHNGRQWLPGLAASIGSQSMQNFDLLVLDNGSSDGTVALLRQWASEEPRLQLIESDKNVGYAAGHNKLIYRAQGDYVLLLNQDVELEQNFLRHAVDAFEGRPRVSAVQGRIRRLDADGQRTDLLDSTGLVIQRSRRATARGQGRTETARDLVAGPVWGADGPAPVYRRSALLDVQEPRTGGGREVLDEDFFMYKEDVDLAWRLRRRGWRAWYEPAAVAWHARGAGAGRPDSLANVLHSRWVIPRHVRARSWRNQQLMQVKNESAAALRRDFVPVAGRLVASYLTTLLLDPARLATMPALVRGLRAAMAKRQTFSDKAPAREGPR